MTGTAPVILLDEVVAHLDPARRAALFDALERLGAQVWMTGADPAAFADIAARAETVRGHARARAKGGLSGRFGTLPHGLAGPSKRSSGGSRFRVEEWAENQVVSDIYWPSLCLVRCPYSCHTKPAEFWVIPDSLSKSSRWPKPPVNSPAPTRPITARNRSRSSRASMRCASVRACISATPTTAPACTTWSTRSSTTRSTRRSPATPRRSRSRSIRTARARCATTAAASRPTSTRAKACRRPRSS